MKFEESLSSGKQSENIVLSMIRNKYPKAYIKEGYHKEYDIMIPEINQTVEVKKDFKSKHTGNIVIEMEMNNKPSGLQTTTADWWVFHLDKKEVVWISLNKLKEMIMFEDYTLVEFIGKGDDVSKLAYLAPKKDLYAYSDKIKELKLDDLL
jgi:hypothetical protein|tara:strand:- start:4796 stop:5248 length:453 start_codon:yes stop_codon:yes gene_type:complete